MYIYTLYELKYNKFEDYDNNRIVEDKSMVLDETNIFDAKSISSIRLFLKNKRDINRSEQHLYLATKKHILIDGKYYIYKIKV